MGRQGDLVCANSTSSKGDPNPQHSTSAGQMLFPIYMKAARDRPAAPGHLRVGSVPRDIMKCKLPPVSWLHICSAIVRCLSLQSSICYTNKWQCDIIITACSVQMLYYLTETGDCGWNKGPLFLRWWIELIMRPSSHRAPRTCRGVRKSHPLQPFASRPFHPTLRWRMEDPSCSEVGVGAALRCQQKTRDEKDSERAEERNTCLWTECWNTGLCTKIHDIYKMSLHRKSGPPIARRMNTRPCRKKR